MRTVQEVEAERGQVYAQSQALKARLRELDEERQIAAAAEKFAMLAAPVRETFVAKVEAQELARIEAEEAALAAQQVDAEVAATEAVEPG
jgi:hypothetical protein